MNAPPVIARSKTNPAQHLPHPQNQRSPGQQQTGNRPLQTSTNQRHPLNNPLRRRKRSRLNREQNSKPQYRLRRPTRPRQSRRGREEPYMLPRPTQRPADKNGPTPRIKSLTPTHRHVLHQPRRASNEPNHEQTEQSPPRRRRQIGTKDYPRGPRRTHQNRRTRKNPVGIGRTPVKRTR